MIKWPLKQTTNIYSVNISKTNKYILKKVIGYNSLFDKVIVHNLYFFGTINNK